MQELIDDTASNTIKDMSYYLQKEKDQTINFCVLGMPPFWEDQNIIDLLTEKYELAYGTINNQQS